MPFWGWMLVAPLLLTLAGALWLALWLRKEWLAIPPDERRPWPEIRAELGGFWPAVRGTLREASDIWREEREVSRRMEATARRAQLKLYEEQRARVRQQIRSERPGEPS